MSRQRRTIEKEARRLRPLMGGSSTAASNILAQPATAGYFLRADGSRYVPKPHVTFQTAEPTSTFSGMLWIGATLPSPSASISPSASLSPSASASASLSLSPSPSASVSPSASPSATPSASASPSPGWENYTRGDEAVLPSDDTDLETSYNAGEVVDVSADDGVRVGQTAAGEYAIHQFKDHVGSATYCTLTCNLQTNCAPWLSTVYLQIYNHNTTTWDTVDSDNASVPDADFDLTANVADLTDYKDGSNVISCRVWQLSV